MLEFATAGVLALVLGRFAGQPDVVPFGFVGAVGVALATIDLAVQRLPDALTLPVYPILIALLALSALAARTTPRWCGRFWAAWCSPLATCCWRCCDPGQLGGGDIKLAGLAGLALGWLGWPTLITGASLGFVLCAVVSLALLASGGPRCTVRSASAPSSSEAPCSRCSSVDNSGWLTLARVFWVSREVIRAVQPRCVKRPHRRRLLRAASPVRESQIRRSLAHCYAFRSGYKSRLDNDEDEVVMHRI